MQTEVIAVDSSAPDASALKRAAEVIKRGGLVAFPTETVYGLGADALNAEAVGRIFAVKERPATNPLIVHLADTRQAQDLALTWPVHARQLAAKFWPGPLTMVLAKSERVPDVVTAGGPTVGLRVPSHPVAQGLVEAASTPIAAPSANLSTRLSATLANHVLRSLDGRIDMLLDGGPTSGGLESTVLDLTVDPPRVLRPGLVTTREIEQVIGPIVSDTDSQDLSATSAGNQPPRSPGMLDRHYAPRARLLCGQGSLVRQAIASGARIGWLSLESCSRRPLAIATDPIIMMPEEPRAYAAQLYAALHELDAFGVEWIVVDEPPVGDEWRAVRDRLRRASSSERPTT